MTTTGTPPRSDAIARGALRGAGALVGAVAAILVVWSLALRVLNVSPFVAKSPVDVWRYLFVVPGAGGNRADIAANLVRTIEDASLGFTLGLVVAALVSLLFHLSRTVERMFVPTFTALHAIPMVTVAPILCLIFGRGAVATSVIGAAIVVVPAMLTMLQGLRAVPPTDVDMCIAYGGSAWSCLAKVALPHAVPTWFSAARVAVTTSVVGALLAEWLASGAGLGGQMLRDANQFQFARLWSSVVVLTVVSVVIYQVVGLIESTVSSRMRAARS